MMSELISSEPSSSTVLALTRKLNRLPPLSEELPYIGDLPEELHGLIEQGQKTLSRIKTARSVHPSRPRPPQTTLPHYGQCARARPAENAHNLCPGIADQPPTAPGALLE